MLSVTRSVIRRSTLYLLLITMIAVMFFSIEFIVEKFIYNNDEVVDILSAIVGAFAFSKFHSSFETFTDRVFYRGQYDYADAVKELGAILGSTIELKTLLELIADFLAKTIKVEFLIFCFDENSTSIFGKALSAGQKEPIKVVCQDLVGYFRSTSSELLVMILEKITAASEADSLDPLLIMAKTLGVAAIIPLRSKDNTTAFMALGRKLSEEAFSTKDIQLLEIISRQAGMATENARLYETLRRYSKELEGRVSEKTARIRAMKETQSKFLVNVAHEFQTPIAILIGNIEMLARTASEKDRQMVYVIEATLGRLSRLVNDLLDTAKLNFSKSDGSLKQIIDVKQLVEGARDDCLILAGRQRIKLFATSEKIFVLGDRDKLREVLLNLISNALKHSSNGGIVMLDAKQKEENAEITVTDTGWGISAEKLPQIFDRFYRIDHRGINQGVGLGLYICRQIIEAHQGTITVESEEGKGTQFTICLPIAPPGATDDAKIKEESL